MKSTKKSKDSKVYYEYYAILGMKEKLYDVQLKKCDG